MLKKRLKLSQILWNIWCTISIVGIWPRFIEPKLLSVTQLKLPIKHLPKELAGLKILHFSDLHWQANFSRSFLNKLIYKINAQQPDFIVFTGDFLCRSKLEDPEGLKRFLCSLKAKAGHFAILGNHDYAHFVTLNANGDYDVEKPSSKSDIRKGFKRLFSCAQPSKKRTDRVKQVKMHKDLINLLEETPFQLLHNATQLVPFGKTFINICGLGEYILGQVDPVQAFAQYDEQYPGVILLHNPDAVLKVKQFPGALILAGHTHGGQVNLPLLWKQFTYLENKEFVRGLKKVDTKWVYVNRGISSIMPFRWFSMPELTLITLQGG